MTSLADAATRAAAVIVSACALLTLHTTEAHACGGCFAPSGTPTIVTQHRMAVALSTTETTLWDQIEYAGAPEDFVWVLPIRGTMAVEVADNAFFEALDQGTRITIQGTFPPCGGGGGGLGIGCGGSYAASAPASDANDGGVTVFHEGVVGPYETATIGAADPDALVLWLHDHGYDVPDSALPAIQHYVSEGMNFAALRLSPNAGVQQMQPVRVTMPGLNVVFPLRMVSAGVSGDVGLLLYVFAEGRYEAQNFPTVEIDRSALVYDWTTASFNYDALFGRAIADNDGRAWVTEYAGPTTVVETYSTYYDDDGTAHSAAADLRVATRSIATPYLTKLRTTLDARFLDQDIVLQASARGDVATYISVSREINRPESCDGGGGGCSATPSRAVTVPGLLALLVVLMAFAWRRRAR